MRAGQNSECPRQPLRCWEPASLLERLQNQQMVARLEEAGDRPASAVPSACRGPGRCAGKGLSCWGSRQGCGSSAQSRGSSRVLSMAQGDQGLSPQPSPLPPGEPGARPPARHGSRPNTTTLSRRTSSWSFRRLDSDSGPREAHHRASMTKPGATCGPSASEWKNLLILGGCRLRLFALVISPSSVQSRCVQRGSPFSSRVWAEGGVCYRKEARLSARGPSAVRSAAILQTCRDSLMCLSQRISGTHLPPGTDFGLSPQDVQSVQQMLALPHDACRSSGVEAEV